MGQTHEIYIHGDGRAACPYCAGLMRTAGNGEVIKCHDCRKVLIRVSGSSISDRVMQYRIGVAGQSQDKLE